ncbi:syntaxin-11a [Electrophorus electricus]|uniref:syntaxin-11a n=1 Tax=Electrophorus electricus TaxID=8005 RepID=UPI000F0A7776|nr:syntaxin-11a [Electrophorus electricus]XP_026867038.1 syntaxin-11a [Electrophorus electricus]XP_026867039.1 syntaxin-11a [Electrophorus electricus]
MKDRLCDLSDAVLRVPQEEAATENGEHADSSELMHQHVVVFEGEDVMDSVFREAQAMHKKIAHLRVEVKRLGKQNTRFLTSVRRISSIKRDSSAIARSIKADGEKLYARLQQMDALCRELEEKHGPQSTLARMAHSQYVSLTGAFHQAMSEYNEAEMAQRENCKTRIQRQAEIMGKEVTGDQIEEMVETGKWNMFSDDLVADGRTFRSVLNEIENRHKELLELESRIRDIHDLFFQLALLVEEQGAMVNNIEANVCATQEYVFKATAEIKKAVRYKKKHPCRQLLCCCFPCCNK